MIIDVERRGRVVLLSDVVHASLSREGALYSDLVSGLELSQVQSVRVVIEIQRRFGGLAPRAFIGGSFTVSNTDKAVLEIRHLPEMSSPGSFAGHLWSKQFLAGIPLEFCDGIRQGIEREVNGEIPGGLLVIDRGGFDEIESSAVIFQQAASVLGRVLATLMREGDAEAQVRNYLSDLES
jgi:hypothetical protein